MIDLCPHVPLFATYIYTHIHWGATGMNLLAARHKVIILLIIYLLTFFFAGWIPVMKVK